MDIETRRSLLKEQLDNAKNLGYKTFISTGDWAYGYICNEKETMSIGVDNFGFVYLSICHVPCVNHGSALSIMNEIAPSKFNLRESITKALMRFGWGSIKNQVKPLSFKKFNESYSRRLVTEY